MEGWKILSLEWAFDIVSQKLIFSISYFFSIYPIILLCNDIINSLLCNSADLLQVPQKCYVLCFIKCSAQNQIIQKLMNR